MTRHRLCYRTLGLIAVLMALMCFGIAAWRPALLIGAFGMVAWSVAGLDDEMDEEAELDAESPISD